MKTLQYGWSSVNFLSTISRKNLTTRVATHLQNGWLKNNIFLLFLFSCLWLYSNSWSYLLAKKRIIRKILYLNLKAFITTTLKVSYICMTNMKQIIMVHNRKMLDTQGKERRMCDCRKQDCPINGSCLMEIVIYRASVTTKNQTKFYVGSTGLSFKNWYTKHKCSHRHEKHSNMTTLSQYIWKLKNNKVNLKI